MPSATREKGTATVFFWKLKDYLLQDDGSAIAELNNRTSGNCLLFTYSYHMTFSPISLRWVQ